MRHEIVWVFLRSDPANDPANDGGDLDENRHSSSKTNIMYRYSQTSPGFPDENYCKKIRKLAK